MKKRPYLRPRQLHVQGRRITACSMLPHGWWITDAYPDAHVLSVQNELNELILMDYDALSPRRIAKEAKRLIKEHPRASRAIAAFPMTGRVYNQRLELITGGEYYPLFKDVYLI